MTDHTGAVYTKNELSYCDWSERVWYVTKIGQDNDLIDHIGAVYAKN